MNPDDDAPRFFTIKPNLFSGRFFFYFGPWDRGDQIRDWYEAHGLKDVDGKLAKAFADDGLMKACGLVIDISTACPMVLLKHVPRTPKDIGDLVHEIHHAVQRWTESLGIYTARESEEVFAYVEGFLIDLALDYLWHGTAGIGLDSDDHWAKKGGTDG